MRWHKRLDIKVESLNFIFLVFFYLFFVLHLTIIYSKSRHKNYIKSLKRLDRRYYFFYFILLVKYRTMFLTNSIEWCYSKKKSRFNNPYNVMNSVAGNIHINSLFNIFQPNLFDISDRKTNNRCILEGQTDIVRD